MEVTLIGYTVTNLLNGSADALVEYAGRTCYNTESQAKPGSQWIQARIRQGHESIIEHASATFRISGISRACSHQLVRHRLASYSQKSQRYVSESQFDFVTPDSICSKPDALEEYTDCMDYLASVYRSLVAQGVPKEDARFVLPNAATTTIVVTMNFRSWRHFIKERGLNAGAQWEIRALALDILGVLARVAPNVFEDLVREAAASK